MMSREFNCHSQGVKNPTENDFSSPPTAITLAQFLGRCGFSSELMVARVQGAKPFVKGMQEHMMHVVQLLLAALGCANRTINKLS
jgi:hypothetical protein